MVALPKYIRGIRKPSGRLLYGYQKFRGTQQAWPRVPLSCEPGSELFARRAELCERLEASRDGSKWSWRFADSAQRRHDLPSPADSAAFWKAIEKAEDVGRRIAAGERKTFSALIAEFKDHTAYTADIAPSTRDQYRRNLDLIDEAWGNDPVTSLTAEKAQKAIDSYQDTPAAARVLRSTLSRVIAWGIPRGYSTDNVAEKTERIDSDGTYAPWPAWAFELFFEKARIDLHLPVYSALFTGQRKVDVLQMHRPDLAVTEMPIVAQKTGGTVPVQIHSEYRAIINAAKPPQPEVIDLRPVPQLLHLRSDGVPWSYEGHKTAWGREMDRKEFAAFRKERLVFHGLRKNAVNMLLEVGCSEARVSAIVGMSQAMVHRYSLQVDKIMLARGAMKQLEEAWSGIRGSVLGTVKRIGP